MVITVLETLIELCPKLEITQTVHLYIPVAHAHTLGLEVNGLDVSDILRDCTNRKRSICMLCVKIH